MSVYLKSLYLFYENHRFSEMHRFLYTAYVQIFLDYKRNKFIVNLCTTFVSLYKYSMIKDSRKKFARYGLVLEASTVTNRDINIYSKHLLIQQA